MIIQETRGHLIFPVPKTPVPYSGRPGTSSDPDTWDTQDWWQTYVLAAELMKKYPDSKLLIATGFIDKTDGPEWECYVLATVILGIPHEKVIVVKQGTETISQLHIADEEAFRQSSQLHVIPTQNHRSRVAWICRKDKIECVIHKVPFGLARPSEIKTDRILAWLFPIIDRLGLRKLFLWCLEKRRANGKL